MNLIYIIFLNLVSNIISLILIALNSIFINCLFNFHNIYYIFFINLFINLFNLYNIYNIINFLYNIYNIIYLIFNLVFDFIINLFF